MNFKSLKFLCEFGYQLFLMEQGSSQEHHYSPQNLTLMLYSNVNIFHQSHHELCPDNDPKWVIWLRQLPIPARLQKHSLRFLQRYDVNQKKIQFMTMLIHGTNNEIKHWTKWQQENEKENEKHLNRISNFVLFVRREKSSKLNFSLVVFSLLTCFSSFFTRAAVDCCLSEDFNWPNMKNIAISCFGS